MATRAVPSKDSSFEDEGKLQEVPSFPNDLRYLDSCAPFTFHGSQFFCTSHSTTLQGDGHYQPVADTDTESNSSDEFDWDAEDDANSTDHSTPKAAKRGRRIWLLFIRLARPLRIFLVALLGCGIFITPFIVVLLRFQSKDTVFQHVRAWSIWFAVSWAAACLTALVTHIIPHVIVKFVLAVRGKVNHVVTC
jgi:hypothetical protein